MFLKGIAGCVFGFEFNFDFFAHSPTTGDPAGQGDFNEEEKEGPDSEIFPKLLSKLVAVEETYQLLQGLRLSQGDEISEKGVVCFGELGEMALGRIAFYGKRNFEGILFQKVGKIQRLIFRNLQLVESCRDVSLQAEH